VSCDPPAVPHKRDDRAEVSLEVRLTTWRTPYWCERSRGPCHIYAEQNLADNGAGRLASKSALTYLVHPLLWPCVN
jgi:hypothetical protein